MDFLRAKMCGGSLKAVTGLVGAFLLLIGGGQIGIGIYFILTIPGFKIASNVWTGITTGIGGISLVYFGCADQPRKKNFSLLILNLISLLTNILNVVIVQVGTKSKFLTEFQRREIEGDERTKLLFQIAVYSSTILSSVVMLFTFAVAQCYFFGHLRRPKLQSQIAFVESLRKEKEENDAGRFFPPSKLAAKEKIQVLPPLEDVLGLAIPGSNTRNDSGWVYSPEDKISKGLYPLGLDINPQANETSQSNPVRHSSFVSPRYARVHHRPQRAQSFATSRSSFSPYGDKGILRPLPVSIPQLQNSSPNSQKLRKSNSFTFNMSNGTITLSRKYHAFTQNRDVNFSVIEVGSLKSINSEHSCSRPLTSFSKEMQEINPLSHMKNIAYSSEPNVLQYTDINSASKDKEHVKPVYKLPRVKGPAPPPPINNNLSVTEQLKNREQIIKSTNETDLDQKYSDNENKCKKSKEIPDDSVVNDDSTDTASFSEIYEEDRELEENNISTSSYEHHMNSSDSGNETSKTCSSVEGSDDNVNKMIPSKTLLELDSQISKKIENFQQSTPEQNKEDQDLKENEPLTLVRYQSPIISKYNKIGDINSSTESEDCQSNNKKDNIYSALDSKDLIKPKNILSKSSKYETVHREIVADTKALLDQLPNGEIQKHKIVLRVPSFKTTGCQTECYRPLRRRASCSQGNYFLHPRYFPSKDARTISYRNEQKNPKIPNVFNVGSSSSSGYSSPDLGSKYASPVQSGPPSPCSSYDTEIDEMPESIDEPNVTVIEINKQESKHLPPRKPPKPSRFRNFSDASLKDQKIPTISENFASIQSYQEYGLTALPENIAHLAEAINPMLVASSHDHKIPRIIDAIYKPQCIKNFNYKAPNENFSFSNMPVHKDIAFTTSSPSLLETQPHGVNNSTAAYLASFELLASQYRQKALANAKQLQIHQKLLEEAHLQQNSTILPSHSSQPNLIPYSE